MTRCVRLHVLRGVRHVRPVIQRTTKFVNRHVIKSSVVSFVPSLLNDTIVHHQPFTPEEFFHVASDDISVTTVIALTTILVKRIERQQK
jgi:hypothetical protein